MENEMDFFKASQRLTDELVQEALAFWNSEELTELVNAQLDDDLSPVFLICVLFFTGLVVVGFFTPLSILDCCGLLKNFELILINI